MNKKFRCGRLILTRNGAIKKVDLEDGGGSRYCHWDYINMNFHTVHYRLLNIFNLRGHKHRTLLYDFEKKPINFRQYATVGEYIEKYGLNCNGTIIYLCTREVDGIDNPRILMKKKRNSFSTQSSTFKQQRFTRSKTNSFKTWTGYRHVVRNESYSNQSQVHSLLHSNQLIIIDLDDSVLYLDYSFKMSSNELMENVRQLIDQNNFHQTLIQIFEDICIIHGYVSSTIESLVQQIQQSDEYFRSINQSEITLYSNSLNNVYDICQLTETLLNTNKNKFNHIRLFSMVTNLFSQFYEHLKVLQKQWLENIEKNNNRFNTTSISSSFTHSSIELTSSQDHREINLENSQISSHSYQTPSLSDAFEQLSSFQESSDESTNKQRSIFQPVLNSLHHLLNLLNSKHLSTFRESIESSIDKIKSVRASINLNDERSICDGKGVILGIKNLVVKKSDELDNNPSKCDLDQQLNGSCEHTLEVIKFLFKTLHKYQLEAPKNNEQDDSN